MLGPRWVRIDPMWWRAPTVLLRQPAGLLAVVVAVAVLVAAGTSAPLFLSAAENAAFNLTIGERNTGVTILGTRNMTDPGAPLSSARYIDSKMQELDAEITETFGPIDGLTTPVAGLAVDSMRRVGTLVGVRKPGDDDLITAVPYWNESALDSVDVTAAPAESPSAENLDVSADGALPTLWLPESVAAELRVAPGDELIYERRSGPVENEQVPVRVGGVYVSPFDGNDVRAGHPRSSMWQQARPLLPRRLGGSGPEPLLLAERDDFLAVANSARDDVRMTWLIAESGPPAATQVGDAQVGAAQVGDASFETQAPMSLSQAGAAARKIRAVQKDVTSPLTDLGRIASPVTQLGGLTVISAIPDAVDRANATLEALLPPLQVLMWSAQAVALALVAASARFLLLRRLAEIRLLAVRGTRPIVIALRAPLEFLPAVLLGTVVGFAAGRTLVTTIGPSTVLTPPRLAQAQRFGLWSTVAALVAIGMVAMLFLRSEERHLGAAESETGGRLGPRIMWEPIVLALAAAGAYQIERRSSDAVAGFDALVLAAPLLLILGGVGAVVRLVGLAMRRAENRNTPSGSDGERSHLRVAGLTRTLARRRLVRATPTALLLVTGAATAIGVLTYGLALAGSTRQAIERKTAIIAGSVATAEVGVSELRRNQPDQLLAAMPEQSTVIYRDFAQVKPTDPSLRVEVIAVDTDTFLDAAMWPQDLMSSSPQEVMAQLATPDRKLPVLVVGDRSFSPSGVPSSGVLEIGGVAVLYDVVDRPAGFPGMRERGFTIVADARQLYDTVTRLSSPSNAVPGEKFVTLPRNARPEVWSAVGSRHLETAAAAYRLEDVPPELDIQTAASAAGRPEILSQRWTLSYLLALGIGAGALAVAGLILYLEGRQTQRIVAAALLRRMGFTRGRQTVTSALELCTLMGMGTVIGILVGLPTAALVVARLDPIPGVPPVPRFVTPSVEVAVMVAGLAMAAALGAMALQWRAERADVAEVLRVVD